MPLYDYECRNCGHRVEVLRGVNDAGPTACERCGGSMRKLLSAPAIVFKGSGWAKKDARDSKSSSSASSATGKTDGADASSTSDSPSKTDSAAAAKSNDGAGAAPGAKESTSSTKTD